MVGVAVATAGILAVQMARMGRAAT
jgi:hypothetical protein